MVGQKIAQYQILERLGAGGMGEIYKAQDLRLNRFVAIKVLTNSSAGDPERRRRFTLEAQASSALNHPNIITIHDILSEGNTEFMVMEYRAGQDAWWTWIPKGGLRLPVALKYAVQMTDALTVAHNAGIVHRDLKPANVMVTESAGLVRYSRFRPCQTHWMRVGLTQRRRRQNADAGPGAVDGGRVDYRDGQLHVAGAGDGQEDRHPLRCLFVRPGAVRNGHGSARVRGRKCSFDALRYPAR